MAAPTTGRKLAAEFLGTFVLVLGGCGSAVLAANFPGPHRADHGLRGRPRVGWPLQPRGLDDPGVDAALPKAMEG